MWYLILGVMLVLEGFVIFWCFFVKEARYDGTVTAIPNEEGTILRFNVDAEDFVDKAKLTFKVVSEEP